MFLAGAGGLGYDQRYSQCLDGRGGRRGRHANGTTDSAQEDEQSALDGRLPGAGTVLTSADMSGNRGGLRAMLVVVLLATSAHAGVIERVLSVGDAVPGGGTVGVIQSHAIGRGGVVAARVQIDADAGAQAILVRAGAGEWRVVARAGDAAPAGGTLQALGRLTVGPDALVVVRADVRRTDGAVVDSLLAYPYGGRGRRLVASGDRTPFGDLSRFTAVDVPSANAVGVVTFRGVDDSGRRALYRIGTDDVRTVLVESGDAIPGGGGFSTFGGPVLADDGAVAFFGSGEFVGAARKGIFVRTAAGVLQAIAFVGDQLTSGRLSVVQSPAIREGGVVAFHGTVVDADGFEHTGNFAGQGNALASTVGLEDGAAPGLARYVALETPTVGTSGLVGFRAVMTLPSEGIVSVGAGAPQLVAAAGDASPLGPAFASFGDPVAGPRWRLAFTASLVDGSAHLFVATVGDHDGAAVVQVDCGLGARIDTALGAVADQGRIEVSGVCRENVVLDDTRRITIVGLRRGGKTRASLVAADGALPAVDVRPSAGALTLQNLRVGQGSPGIRIEGTGHVLDGVEVQRAGVQVAGEGHRLQALRVVKASSTCLSVTAPGTTVNACRLVGCGADGLSVVADRTTIDGCVITKARAAGATVTGDGHALTRNVITDNAGVGLRVTGLGSTLTRNRVLRNRAGGLLVQGCNVDGGKNRTAGNRGGPNRDFDPCAG